MERVRVGVLESRRDDARAVAGDKPRGVGVRRADHFGASVGAGIQDGAAVTSSGAKTPTERS